MALYGKGEPFAPPGWRRSSYSFANGQCTEVRFRKSSRSAENGNCIEAATHCDVVDVRDSKDPDGPVLTFSPAAWTAFVAGVRNREFR